MGRDGNQKEVLEEIFFFSNDRGTILTNVDAKGRMTRRGGEIVVGVTTLGMCRAGLVKENVGLVIWHSQ